MEFRNSPYTFHNVLKGLCYLQYGSPLENNKYKEIPIQLDLLCGALYYNLFLIFIAEFRISQSTFRYASKGLSYFQFDNPLENNKYKEIPIQLDLLCPKFTIHISQRFKRLKLLLNLAIRLKIINAKKFQSHLISYVACFIFHVEFRNSQSTFRNA